MTSTSWVDPGEEGGRSVTIDLRTDLPHPARIHDYLLGGEGGAAGEPRRPDLVPGEPSLHAATVHYLAAQAGIRQFLDIGAGLPTSPNVHEVAQAVTPDARIVYADNDRYGRVVHTSG